MFKDSALLFLCVALFASFQLRADTTASTKDYGVGLALALPAVGVALKAVLSDRHTVSAVIGNGFQAQINFTGKSPDGGYYLLGTGRDDNVGLIRIGYGHVWRSNNFSYHVEAALNVPVWRRELDGLGGLGDVVYIFPIGFGVYYHF